MVVEKKKERNAEIPTASLADIAFLVLIFFLVSSTIDVDKGISLVLPAKGETKDIRKENIANLLVNAQGEVMLDNEMVPIPMIKNIVREKLAQNDKLIISVKTDRETEYQVYIKVMDQLKQAGAKRISLAEPD
ncbi:MAG: biopolymer transporter ExbD [candidate division KSB1 bacterium]|nr:biopolymer transporter ExbD [candidate division KSB1 bacterium]MDQ7064122.1 biopolymer transporter ExbD [candidate division KSB1 bacterium]